MINTKTVLGAAALFAGTVNGHMIMATPQPFGKPDNSPLQAGGSDYPCKLGQTNGFMGTAIQMKSGSSQPLTFSGSAVHGGGSCQMSLSKDTAPTPSSSFKVIHSFLGACPGVNGPSTFQFTIPSEVPNGKYTLAWTWFNNIGNREMYMNCAPVEVTGASASDSSFSGLPDMAIYNIANKNSCKTVETFDVQFPNPGKYVTTAGSFKPKAPTGTGCDTGSGSSGSSSGGSTGSGSGAGTGAGSGAGSSSGSSGSSGSFGEGASAGSGGSATTSANNGLYTPQSGSGSSGSGSGAGAGAGSAGSAAASGSGSAATGSAGSGSGAGAGAGSGSSATGGAAGSAPTATSLLTVYTTQTGSGSAATGAAGSGTSGAGNGTSSDGSGSSGSSSSSGSSGSSSGGSSSGSSAGTSTPGGSCSPDGSVVCSADGSQYGLCNFGSVAMMPVAAGTKCSNGQIMRRSDFMS